MMIYEWGERDTRWTRRTLSTGTDTETPTVGYADQRIRWSGLCRQKSHGLTRHRAWSQPRRAAKIKKLRFMGAGASGEVDDDAGPARCEHRDNELPAAAGRGRSRKFCDATCRSRARRARSAPARARCAVRAGVGERDKLGEALRAERCAVAVEVAQQQDFRAVV